MAAPKGNQFWRKRATHGRDKLFSDPVALRESCCEYFEWVEANPLKETKAFSHMGKVTTKALPLMRAMTIGGLCVFLGIDQTTWRDYRTQDDFSPIMGEVEEIIRDQKFSGAACGLLNANIIARDLGLKDASDHNFRSSDGSMTPAPTLIEIVALTNGDSADQTPS